MTVEQLLSRLKRLIAEAQEQDKITPARIGPYGALENIATEIREFEEEEAERDDR